MTSPVPKLANPTLQKYFQDSQQMDFEKDFLIEGF